MEKKLRWLFNVYQKLGLPTVVSLDMASGRRIQVVIVGFEDGVALVYEATTTDWMTHLSIAHIEDFRDMSASESNIITKEQARGIYEKHFGAHQKAHDDKGGPAENPAGAAKPSGSGGESLI